ncbi:hypothetical protein BDZ89DRAFT_1065341 [Hymenopellis radicata]|nr:hypothetical protein BDZ89DRAFT_1065341 [Hymenopellis radicata]
MLRQLLPLLALVSTVVADVYITFPVSGSSMSGGSPYNLTWMDDGAGTYALSDFGAAQFSIAVGGTSEQVCFYVVDSRHWSDIDVSTTSMFEFTVDASIGGDSDGYFIRVDSNNLTDSDNNGYAMQSFSAKYTMDGMTGTFNSTMEALIADSTSTTEVATSTTTKHTSTSTRTSTSTSTASSSSSTDSNGVAGSQPQVWLGAVFSAALCLFFY